MTPRLTLPYRRLLLDGLAIALAVLAAFVAATLPHQTLAIGPLTVTAQPSIGWPGETILRVPPFGTATARTHDGPLRLTLTVDEVDLPAVQRLLKGTPRSSELQGLISIPSSVAASGTVSDVIERETEGAARHLRQLAALSLIAATLAGAAVALLLRRAWRVVGFSAALSFVLVLTSLGLAAVTFDANRLAEPRLQGALAYVPRLQTALTTRISKIKALRAQVAGAANNLAGYYADPRSISTGGGLPGTYRVLQVGDLHLDPVGAQFARSLVRAYNVSLVIDAGDIPILGGAEEAKLIPSLEVTSVPVVYLPGNHDSKATLDALKKMGNVTVATTSTPLSKGGLTILPLPDPSGMLPGIEPDITAVKRRYLAAADELKKAEALGAPHPDIILLHNPFEQRVFTGLTPLVLSGHTHTAAEIRRGNTVFLNSGTLGGMPYDPEITGRRRLPHGATILYYTPGMPRKLIALDRISVGVEGDTSLERTVIDPSLLSP